MKVNLKGKVALVTGAARGIGKAIAEALSLNDAKVVFGDVDFAAAKESAANIRNGVAMELDVSDESQVQAVVDNIVRELGHLDILINNAGVNTLAHRVNIDQFPTAEWRRILEVDLTGLFFVSRSAARPMLAQKSGRIINISSVLGIAPARLQSPFIAAKAGVINLTKAMALELGAQGVLVILFH